MKLIVLHTESLIIQAAIIVAALLLPPFASAQNAQAPKSVSHTDSVLINFRQSKWNLDYGFSGNASALDSINHRLTHVLNDSVYQLRHVSIYGGASPEGSVDFNKFLSEKRAATLFGWFDKFQRLSDADKTYTFFGRDWDGVLWLAEQDPKLPHREETLALLRSIAEQKRAAGGKEPAGSLEKLKALQAGVPYKYLYSNVFPKVRASKVVIDYERILAPEIAEQRKTEAIQVVKPDTVYIEKIIEKIDTVYIEVHDTVYIETCHQKPFYMDVRSNMVYDALALPNVGLEFYLGKDFSIGANWLYAWWSRESNNFFWRAYGGELFGRWWFGNAAHRKPLTGHHIGAYGQVYTYDFELSGDGEMGGKPGGNLWDRCMWGLGLEYGYSLPVGKRINIDFSLGMGYSTGLYHKYDPQDGHYVWQSTHRRNYFGPTKLEVALVWLLGHDNVNRGKGGDV